MNTWPTLQEWWQFGGALTLEVGILFLAAKLIALRLRSAPWRRALWQTVVVAMFIVVVGELNGVRGLMIPRREPAVPAPTQRAVVVTFKDAELPAPLPLEVVLPDQVLTREQPATLSRWQEQAPWPALAWLAGTLLVAGRVLLAQFIALVFRLSCRRTDDPVLNARGEQIRRTLGVRRRVRFVESARAVAPFTFGTLWPVIVLPRRFTDTFTPEQQDAALLHEMAHVAGFDSAWRGLSDMAVTLFWWHPLAWLARRELAHASELAADESSLLLHDGPGRLAECLVACAKELRRPALTTWLGMDGGGFRSALGRRVARLLELPARARLSRPVPWYVRLLAPVVVTAFLWMGMVMMMKPGPTHDVAWHASILGRAFAAQAEDKAPVTSPRAAQVEVASTNREAADQAAQEIATAYRDQLRSEVAKRVQDGKLFYETGRYEAARSNLQAALRLDPKHPGAEYYLSLLNASLSLAAARDSANAGGASRLHPQRQLISDQLRQINLAEWGPIDNRPLSEVIRDLNDAIIRRDKGGKGISIFISSNAAPAWGGAGLALDPAGLPIPAAAGEALDLNGVNIRLGTKLKELSIEEILNILMVVAETKIKYTVEDFGIMISSRGNEPTPLHTRFFRMDPNTFQQALQSVQTQALTNRTSDPTSPRGGKLSRTNSFMTEVDPAASAIPHVRQLFKSAGVDLSGPGKSIFYNDRIGALMVRATLQELDTVETVMQMLNMNPPQVEIQVKVMEVRRDESNKLDLNLFLGAVTNGTAGERRLAQDLTLEQMRSSRPEPATFTGLLTDEQFRAAVKVLEQRGGTDLLSAPKVTTLSGRQAQIQVVNIKYIVTDLEIKKEATAKEAPIKGAPTQETAAQVERRKAFKSEIRSGDPTVLLLVSDDESTVPPIAEPFELGLVIDVIPYVNADGRTIQMTVLPKLREFLGYDPDPLRRKEDIQATGGPFANNQITTPRPKFRLRQVSTTTTVLDGQTLVIGAGTARTVERKRGASGVSTTNYVEKELFFFITPRVLDPAGNLLRAE